MLLKNTVWSVPNSPTHTPPHTKTNTHTYLQLRHPRIQRSRQRLPPPPPPLLLQLLQLLLLLLLLLAPQAAAAATGATGAATPKARVLGVEGEVGGHPLPTIEGQVGCFCFYVWFLRDVIVLWWLAPTLLRMLYIHTHIKYTTRHL